MFRSLVAVLFLSVLGLIAPFSHAAEPGFYLGGSIGQTSADICDGLSGCDDEDTGFKIFGGYSFNKNFAIEGGYFNPGESRVSGPGGFLSIEGSSIFVDAVGIIPLNEKFSLLGKIGLQRWEAEAKGVVLGAPVSESDDGTDLKFGLGAQFDITQNFGARVEWERFDFDDTDIDFLSVGVLFRF